MAIFLLQEWEPDAILDSNWVHHFASVFHFETRKMQQASWDST
jgi:hypothetical protein